MAGCMAAVHATDRQVTSQSVSSIMLCNTAHPSQTFLRRLRGHLLAAGLSQEAHGADAFASLLQTMYAASFLQQRADRVQRLLAQQVRAERVSGGLR